MLQTVQPPFLRSLLWAEILIERPKLHTPSINVHYDHYSSGWSLPLYDQEPLLKWALRVGDQLSFTTNFLREKKW